MKFGIFDHVDANGLAPADYYESRLQICETYDRLGFHAYHLAEHHATPLGLAPSPNVLMAAIAQRTSRLRFGPFVYALPLHNPLRLVEEIAMLDHMSRGRIDLGFGRGSSPVELMLYGVDATRAEELYREGLEVVRAGLTSERLSFAGATWHFDGVPMLLGTYQKPHPPIWYGAHAPDSADRAARLRLNIVSNDHTDRARIVLARYRDTWASVHGGTADTLLGLVRFIYVAPTDDAALAIARRAYKTWQASFMHLWRQYGRLPNRGERIDTFDGLRDIECKGIAGTPDTVAKYLQAHITGTGATYLVGQFVFGNMTTKEALSSIELFAREVMPRLQSQ